MAANQQPPAGGDTSNILPGLVGVSFLFAITLVVYGFRIYMATRIHPLFRLPATHYIVSAALLCELATLSSVLTAIHFGLGRYDYYISSTDRTKILKCFYSLGFLGFWASSLARISIGSMLLRFEISNLWRVVLWTLIFTQLGMAIWSETVQLLQCRPIHAIWDFVPHAICWSPQKSQSYGYIHAGTGIISDLVFTIMPMFFIWSLPRPVIERALVSILMAFGIIAAVAGGMKLHMIKLWDPREPALRNWVPLLWWYRVEEIGLITAACVPFLKPLIERALGRFSVIKFGFLTISLPAIQSSQGGSANEGSNEGSSTQQTGGEQQLAQQNLGNTTSVVESGIVDNTGDRGACQREKSREEV